MNKKVNLLNDDSISVLREAQKQTSGKKHKIDGNQEPTEQLPEENDGDWSTISTIS